MNLYGASGHAKVIIDILKSQGIVVKGLYDDNKDVHELLEIPVLQDPVITSPLIICLVLSAKKLACSIINAFGLTILIGLI